MYIINGNNEVFEIKDPSLVRRFTNLRPDGEPLVIDGFENGIRLEDVVEVCVYDGELRISKSEDESADLEIEILQWFSNTEFTISIKNRIEQLSVCLGMAEIEYLPECIWNMKNLNELRLYSWRITPLPESIGNLSRLNSLDLSSTVLAELPESIGNLSRLSSLDLSSTVLTELPESIGNLSNLVSLYLSGTKLTELPESIGNLSSLSSLDLRGTKLTELPESIGNLSSLSSLDLRGTKLRELPESIGNLSSLSSLDLSDTELTELPESIGNLSSLSSLDLSDTELTELPESIVKLSSLSSLDLSDTELTELPESIGNLSSLSGLDLSDTELTKLPESIGNLSSLSSLDLSDTELTELPESIVKLSSLCSLDLRGTKLRELPESIGNLSSLSVLDLSNTDLTKLPEIIGKLNSLSRLNLCYTKLRELPESIGNLRSLSGLELSGTDLTELPENIGNLSSLSGLDLSNTNLTELPENIGNLRSLSSLDLNGTKLKELPESIGNLRSLSSLDLNGTKLKELPESIGNLSGLSRLNLCYTNLTELPESIGNLSNLSSLDLRQTELTELPESVGNLNNLSSLDLRQTGLTELPESVGNLNNLSSLDLRQTGLTELPESIGNLSSLSNLRLARTSLTELPESIGNLNSLVSLHLSGTKLTELPESIGNLNSLVSLYLSGTKLTELPESIGNLSSLRILYLSNTGLTELSESIGNLSGLSRLDLSGTGLTTLPECIGNIKSLQALDLSGMHLNSIDKSIIDLKLDFIQDYFFTNRVNGIGIKGLSLEIQPISLFLQPRPLIEEYFASEMVPVNTIKCIVLGYGNAGKTYTISRLLNGGLTGNYVTKETPGVEIRSYETKRKSGAFTINFWDFGGQEIMYSMHRCFLTERSCYLIVIDNRRADMDMMAQARFWLKNIATFVSGAPVIIMANMWEKDEYRDDIDVRRLREEFGKSVDLKRVIPISAKTSTEQQFNYELIDKIEELAESMVSHDMKFPVKWSKIRSELHEMGKEQSNYYISQEDYYSICQKYGVEDRDIQNWLLDWFNDLGDCFSYYKSSKEKTADLLEEYKVLDPRWITNAIYILITRGYGFIDHQRSPGILTKTAIVKILENAEGGVIKYIKEYKAKECSYIMRVMEKFELAYDVNKDGGTYFIPALLTKKEPDNKRPAKYRQLVKYALKYEFLPSNTLHKLMVRFYDELELSRCWDKGMVLRNTAIDQWVLLDMGGGDDKLHIEVYACGRDPAYKMLNLILKRLQVVNESLSLKPVHYIITQDEYKQEIEVEDLLELKNGPRKRDLYQGKKVDYNIDELLGNTFGPVVRQVNEIEDNKAESDKSTGPYTLQLLDYIKEYKEPIDSGMLSKNKKLISIIKAIEKRFRKQFDNPPSNEKEVQEQLRKFFDANGLEQGTDYERESGKFQFAGREYIPDFVLKDSNTALEVKILKDKARKNKMIKELNEDYSAYTKKYGSLIYLVYDIGCISDTEQFKRDFEDKGNVRVLVVKH